MKRARLFLACLPMVLCACTSGGGSSSVSSPAWEKFRHDTSNSGQASGSMSTTDNNVVTTNSGATKSVQIDAGAPSPISASPAIGLDGTIYVGTEGGTLAAVHPSDLSLRRATCVAPTPIRATDCPPGPQALGPLVSSPAVYSLNGTNSTFVGSQNGTFFGFQDDGTDDPSCNICFQPRGTDIGAGVVIQHAAFVASPTFTINSVTALVSAILVGARLDVATTAGTQSIGQFYAINADGSIQWEYPRPGDSTSIGPVTSSAALGTGSTVYFTATDLTTGTDTLYALTHDGTLKWRLLVGALPATLTPFMASPLTTSNSIYVTSASGDVVAVNPDSSVRWRGSSGALNVGSSLAAAIPAVLSPTPTPAGEATPTPAPAGTGTPTATPTALGSTVSVFNITSTGVVAFDAAAPTPTRLPLVIPSPVVSSPAVSSDGFLIFGTADGRLHAVNTSTGAEPSGWPVVLADGVPIRSSPSIANDNNIGTIYVGADDGKLYAVGP